ncbi:hypothetical protein FQ087_18195 [Sporosarcina sp. ANT_H38]|uniref:hypothetical protein n=1 Tax=Sporosarcina sp. ANT_H38 TaxID=2597358 RepID=UPI0011F297BF|nr:hypothetical protein [Sporosarcina sp. ANT_H38]KAA0944057.1 hypothetical protein FQ087_18195 [Sporosarcina sp. ANT_H38]
MNIGREQEGMPILQNHEQRITILETTVSGLSHKMDSVKTAVETEGAEQKALLNRLIDHHLDTNKIKLSQFWKVVFNLSGASGLIGVIIYAATQFFK